MEMWILIQKASRMDLCHCVRDESMPKKNAYGARSAHFPSQLTAKLQDWQVDVNDTLIFPNTLFLHYVSPDDFQTEKVGELTRIVREYIY